MVYILQTLYRYLFLTGVIIFEITLLHNVLCIHEFYQQVDKH
jgi:hypothetical protein